MLDSFPTYVIISRSQTIFFLLGNLSVEEIGKVHRRIVSPFCVANVRKVCNFRSVCAFVLEFFTFSPRNTRTNLSISRFNIVYNEKYLKIQ